MASLRTIVGIIALASLPGLMSCAVVDQYSGRAVAYNLEAEQAQEQSLLLNVVRATLRRPMQFSTVSSITGAASATGGVGYTAPVNVPFRPITNGSSIAAFPPLNTWSMSAGMSGGPTFTVPVLDTQEFYEGIMKPIPGAMYDLYNQGEYPRDLLFNLFVQKVVMTLDKPGCVSPGAGDSVSGSGPVKSKSTNPKSMNPKSMKPESGTRVPAASETKPRSTSDCEFVFHNTVGDELELQLFQALGDYLMLLGLSTESTPAPEDFFSNDKSNPNIKGFEVKISGPSPFGSSSGGSSSSGSSGSSSDSQPKSYGFCFSPRTAEAGNNVPRQAYWCKNVRPKGDGNNQPAFGRPERAKSEIDDEEKINVAKDEERIKSTGSATGKIVASVSFIENLKRIARDSTINRDNQNLGDVLKNFSGQDVYLSFTLRSVEAMIYYLGEIARRELAPEYQQTARVIFIKTVAHYALYPNEPCAAASDICRPIFVLAQNTIPKPDEILSVVYGANRYAVPGGKAGGWSSAVLEIVKQQLALNSSAKSLPQSNVISLVGQ
jgi:hypothetical protein